LRARLQDSHQTLNPLPEMIYQTELSTRIMPQSNGGVARL
jgi:hypothetical protein